LETPLLLSVNSYTSGGNCMLTDPLPNITLATVSQTLPKTKQMGSGKTQTSIYSKSDGSLVVTIIQDSYREGSTDWVRARVIAEQFVTAPDPFNAELTKKYRQRHEYQFSRPTVVFTETQVVDMVNMVTGFMTATSNTNAKKLNGGEL